MRITIFLAAIILFVSCNENSENSLVQKYSFRWDSNLGLRYYIPETIPTVEFLKIHEVDDGYIVFARSFDVYRAYVIKVGIDGEFIDEKIIDGEAVYQVLPERGGGFYVVSATQNNFFVVRRYDDDLTLMSYSTFDISLPVFRKYFYLSNGFLRIRGDNLLVEKFNMKGIYQWEKSLTDFQLPDGISSMGLIPKDEDEATLVYFREDQLMLRHLDPLTGDVYWSKDYSIASDFAGAKLSYNFNWNDDNKLHVAGTKTMGTTNYLSIFGLNSSGEIFLTSDIEFPKNQTDFIGPIVSTSDRGSIISLNGNPQNDTVNFRLLKIDRNGNPGWIGTFRTDGGYDNLTSIEENTSGELIILSYYGKITLLKPE